MIDRTVYSQIEHSISMKPVTLITGARQVGKTTLCGKLAKEHGYSYVTLRDRNERETARRDPEMFLAMHPFPLIIDEVQYAPGLFESIEAVVDREKFVNGKSAGLYVLTASQAFSLMEGVTDSLAGRIAVIRMSPLSLSEKLGREEIPFTIDRGINARRSSEHPMGPSETAEMMIRGMYPEPEVARDMSAYEFYSDYVDSYIDRDVSQIINVRNKEKFHQFMQVVASLTGQELVYDTVARNVGIDMKTCKAWIGVLVSSELIFLLRPYAERSTVKRITKRPKLYFWDTGLACHLARIPDASTLMASYLKGPVTETFIISEIMKTYRNRRIEPSMYYNRDSRNSEVDLVMVRDGKISLVECKAGTSFDESNVRSMKGFASNFEPGGSCIICLAEKPYPVSDGIYALPVTAI